MVPDENETSNEFNYEQLLYENVFPWNLKETIKIQCSLVSWFGRTNIRRANKTLQLHYHAISALMCDPNTEILNSEHQTCG